MAHARFYFIRPFWTHDVGALDGFICSGFRVSGCAFRVSEVTDSGLGILAFSFEFTLPGLGLWVHFLRVSGLNPKP